MIRPRYLLDSIVAQWVSVSAFLHSLDPKATFGLDGLTPRLHLNSLAYGASGKKRPMAEERTQRRLAAILAADVAGYSRPWTRLTP